MLASEPRFNKSTVFAVGIIASVIGIFVILRIFAAGTIPSKVAVSVSFDAVRQETADSITYSFDAGLNRVSQPLSLSGAACAKPVVITSKDPANKASIIGDRAVPFASWVAMGSGVYKADISSFGLASVSTIFGDGGDYRLAKFPKLNGTNTDAPQITAWDPATGGAYQIETNSLAITDGLAGFTAVIPTGWGMSRLPISASSKTIAGTRLTLSPEAGFIEYKKSDILGGGLGPFHLGTQKFYLENHLSFVTAPGEWAYDQATKQMYVYPYQAGDLSNMSVSFLENIVEANSCTASVTIKDIALGRTNFNTSPTDGYVGFSGDYYYSKSADGTLNPFNIQPYAIKSWANQSFVVSNTSFQHLGGGGIVGTDPTQVSITRSSFSDVAGTALKLVNVSFVATDVGMSDSSFSNIGYSYASDALSFASLKGSLITHNNFDTIGGRALYTSAKYFLDTTTASSNNQFTNNRVSNALQLVNDAGVVNNSGSSGLKVNNNYFYQQPASTWNSGSGKSSVAYLDVGSYGVSIQDNLVENADTMFNINCQGGNTLNGNGVVNSGQLANVTFSFCNPFKNLYYMSQASIDYLDAQQQAAGCVYSTYYHQALADCSCNVNGDCPTSSTVQAGISGSAGVANLGSTTFTGIRPVPATPTPTPTLVVTLTPTATPPVTMTPTPPPTLTPTPSPTSTPPPTPPLTITPSPTVSPTVTPSPTPTPTPTPVCTKLGDANCDGRVNSIDLQAVLSNYGKKTTLRRLGDLTGDGIVNIFDLSQILHNWGR